MFMRRPPFRRACSAMGDDTGEPGGRIIRPAAKSVNVAGPLTVSRWEDKRIAHGDGSPLFAEPWHGGATMDPALGCSLLSFLAEVPDPRSRHGRRHPLTAILAFACCALMS